MALTVMHSRRLWILLGFMLALMLLLMSNRKAGRWIMIPLVTHSENNTFTNTSDPRGMRVQNITDCGLSCKEDEDTGSDPNEVKETSSHSISGQSQDTQTSVQETLRHTDNSTQTSVELTQDGDFLDICTQNKRLQLLETHCKNESNTKINTKFFQNIFIDHKHKILACLPPKSGCTTWKAILANNSGSKPLPRKFDPMRLHLGTLPKYGIKKYTELRSTDERKKVLYDKSYTKIMIVRHPFDRVYSAYYDKIKSKRDRKMMQMHGSRILNKFHPELDPKIRRKGEGAKFKEFIDYIKLPISLNQAWEHWDAVYDICQPCHIHYDYILKTETLDSDNTQVIRQHLGPYYRGVGTAGNAVGKKHVPVSSTATTKGKVLSAYIALNESDIKYLNKRFYKDFHYFGYSWKQQDDSNGDKQMYAYCAQGAEGRMCC